jgi:hypothetical protein
MLSKSKKAGLIKTAHVHKIKNKISKFVLLPKAIRFL